MINPNQQHQQQQQQQQQQHIHHPQQIPHHPYQQPPIPLGHIPPQYQQQPPVPAHMINMHPHHIHPQQQHPYQQQPPIPMIPQQPPMIPPQQQPPIMSHHPHIPYHPQQPPMIPPQQQPPMMHPQSIPPQPPIPQPQQQPPIPQQPLPQQPPIPQPIQPQQPQPQPQQQRRNVPPPHSYHSQQSQLSSQRLTIKKYEIQRPDKKDLGPGLGPPDFFPLDEKSKEDSLTQEFILGGFYERYSHDENKSSSNSFKNFDFSNVKEQLLQSIYEIDWKKNSTSKSVNTTGGSLSSSAATGTASGQNTAKTNKRSVPEQKAWSANHRESWVLKLAGNEPLSKLALSVPHGYKGETLLKMFLDNQVPLIRATWYTKIVYGNMPKHKTVEPSNDWTKTIMQSLFALIRNTAIEGAASLTQITGTISSGIGSNSSSSNSSNKKQPSYSSLLYIERLIRWNFSEGLLNRDILLSMLIDHMNEIDRPEEAVLIVSLLMYYSDTLIQSTFLSLRFIIRAYEKLIKIKSIGSNSNSSTNTPQQHHPHHSHHHSHHPIKTSIHNTSANQLHQQLHQQQHQQIANTNTNTNNSNSNNGVPILSGPNQKIYSMLCIISKQISMSLPDTFMSFKHFKELVTIVWPANIFEKIESYQLSFIHNLQFTVSPEYKWLVKYYSEINNNQNNSKLNSNNSNMKNITNAVNNNSNSNNNNNSLSPTVIRKNFYDYSDMVSCLDKFYNVYDIKLLYKEIFGNQISLENDRNKIILICEWACTSCRNYPYSHLSATSLLKLYERNLVLKFNSSSNSSSSNSNLSSTNTTTTTPTATTASTPSTTPTPVLNNNHPLQNILVSFLETFSPNPQERLKICYFYSELTRCGIFSQNSYARYLISRGVLDSNNNDNSNNNHRYYLLEFPIFNQNDFPSYDIHQQRNQRRTILFANTNKSHEEISNMESTRDLIKRYILDPYNSDSNANSTTILLDKIHSLSFYSQTSLSEWLSLCIRLYFIEKKKSSSSAMVVEDKSQQPTYHPLMMKGFRYFSFPMTPVYIDKCFMLMESIMNTYSLVQCLMVFWENWDSVPELHCFILYTTIRLEIAFIASHQFTNLLDVIYKILKNNINKNSVAVVKNHNSTTNKKTMLDQQMDEEDEEDDAMESNEYDDEVIEESNAHLVQSNNNINHSNQQAHQQKNQFEFENLIDSYFNHLVSKYKSIKVVSLWIKFNKFTCKTPTTTTTDDNSMNVDNSNSNSENIFNLNQLCKDSIQQFIKQVVGTDPSIADNVTLINTSLDDELISNSITLKTLNSFNSAITSNSSNNNTFSQKDICTNMINCVLENISSIQFTSEFLTFKYHRLLSNFLCHFFIFYPLSMNAQELLSKLFKSHLSTIVNTSTVNIKDCLSCICSFILSLIIHQCLDVYSIIVNSILPLLPTKSTTDDMDISKISFIISLLKILVCETSIYHHDNRDSILNEKEFKDYCLIFKVRNNNNKIKSLSSLFPSICMLYDWFDKKQQQHDASTTTTTTTIFNDLKSILTEKDFKYVFLLNTHKSVESIKQLNLDPVTTRYLFYLISGDVETTGSNSNSNNSSSRYERITLDNCIKYSYQVVNQALSSSINCYWNIHLSYLELGLLLEEWQTLPPHQFVNNNNSKSTSPIPGGSPMITSSPMTSTTTAKTSSSSECILTQFILYHFVQNRGWEKLFLYENLFLILPLQVRNELVSICINITESQFKQESFQSPLEKLSLVSHIKNSLFICTLIEKDDGDDHMNIGNGNSSSSSKSDQILLQESFTDLIINILSTYQESSPLVQGFVVSICKQLNQFIQYTKQFDALNAPIDIVCCLLKSLLLRITLLIPLIDSIGSNLSTIVKLDELSITFLNMLGKFMIQSDEEFGLFDTILTLLSLLLSDKFEITGQNTNTNQATPPINNNMSLQQQQNLIDQQRNLFKRKLYDHYSSIKHQFPVGLQNKIEQQLSFLSNTSTSSIPLYIYHPPAYSSTFTPAASSSSTITTTATANSTPTSPAQQSQTPKLIVNPQDIKAYITPMDPWVLLEDFSETPLSPSVFGGVKMERKDLTYIKSAFPTKSMNVILVADQSPHHHSSHHHGHHGHHSHHGSHHHHHKSASSSSTPTATNPNDPIVIDLSGNSSGNSKKEPGEVEVINVDLLPSGSGNSNTSTSKKSTPSQNLKRPLANQQQIPQQQIPSAPSYQGSSSASNSGVSKKTRAS
ncbi:hypothetical protein CYY_008146 [Polysphondylium violaceum]|uniref:Mediator complex subunit Med12 domain-containing protein n=1 Tax=Polysphondylium violaceum TaxID=133409 RepID=A0A8J4PVV5_9MYCE|nr:hypothetical protein CYY_008146 [Polysphondylium violaceum]